MAFDQPAYDAQYKKDHYRQVLLRYTKEYYADTLEPAAKEAGESVGVYIKNAVKMRIEKDGSQEPVKTKELKEPEPIAEAPEPEMPETDSGIAGLL